MKNTLTTILVGLLAAAPQFVATLPADDKALATALLAFLGALYHLYQPSPTK